MFCHNCGTELDDGSAFCSVCGSAQTAPESVETADPSIAPPKKRKRHVGLIIISCIVALLAAVVAVGVFTNWFGFYGPVTKIALAARNTTKEGNFTIVVSSKANTSPESRAIDASSSSIAVDIDFDNRELMLYSKTEQVLYGDVLKIHIGIYDGYLISGYRYSNQKLFTKKDISEDLDELFDAYEDPQDIDWDELFDIINESIMVDLNDHLDSDAMDQSVLTYYRSLNNNKWLKENAGYSTSKDGGTRFYTFEPDLYTFSKASLECFKPAFKTQADYDSLLDSLQGSSGGECELTFGVYDNQLTDVNLKIHSSSLNMEYTIEFQDIGTTEVPVNTLEDMLSQAI